MERQEIRRVTVTMDVPMPVGRNEQNAEPNVLPAVSAAIITAGYMMARSEKYMCPGDVFEQRLGPASDPKDIAIITIARSE